MSGIRLIGALCLLLLLSIPVGAQQDHPVPVDGPALAVEADSLDARIRSDILPVPALSPAMAFDMFSRMIAPPFESRQYRAYRANSRAVQSVLPSVRENMSRSFRPIQPQYYPLLMLAGLFLTPQFSIPYGYYPMMSPSNPFAIAKTPGWAPEQNMYSPELIPQAVELEYDFATGTYRQKMVDWKVYQQRISTINPSNFNIAPVPRIPINDVERRVMSGYL